MCQNLHFDFQIIHFLSDLLYFSKVKLTTMLYNKIENTYIVDEEDAILLYGQQEYNRLTKSGDIYYVTKTALKSSKASAPIYQGKRITNNKRVICVETGRVFNSVTEVNKEFGYNKGNIVQCCKGKLKTANGFHWKYA